ncbi:MAG TPA: MSMEG_0569 family flavin-dependent oxidoreductase [Mycobacteriales bacterium]|jgi:putative flavoprotein involved in K+ transport|nr:MSMEG_0569 family flavin-dependent oxidoreductase [Mycobacteriales bacterium]
MGVQLERQPVVVVGAGQAGLSMSWHLGRRGIDHVVLERERIGHEWRTARWDSFCLVTPNWQCQLPGFPYSGDDPDGFMVKDEIVRYIEAYAASFEPPVRAGVAVTGLTREPGVGPFLLQTSAGPLCADQVVVATGGYHHPVVPRLAERLPVGITQLHSSQYRNPGMLPHGDVLVVGTGQSGAQIAEDLHLAGRRVHLAVGRAPRVARFYRGRDVVAWLADLGYYDMPVTDHPLGVGVRANTNHYVTGRDGGRDIDLRAFAADGMRLYGRLEELRGERLCFADDLAANLDHADEVSESIKNTIDRYIAKQGIVAPAERRYTPVWRPDPDHPRVLDPCSAGITSVVWCIGYRADYGWIDLPVFNGRGYPTHHRGVTSEPGLHFLGLPWQHTWGSGRFSGVARDAEHLGRVIAGQFAARLDGGAPNSDRLVNALALGS